MLLCINLVVMKAFRYYSFIIVPKVLLLTTLTADGQITADFEHGKGEDTPHQFPGKAGDGWAGPWKKFIRNTEEAQTGQKLISKDAISGEGALLLSDRRSPGSGQTKRSNTTREWERSQDVDPFQPFVLEYQFRVLSFDGRKRYESDLSFFLRGSRDAQANYQGGAAALRLTGYEDLIGGFFEYRDGSQNVEFSKLKFLFGEIYTVQARVDPVSKTYKMTVSGTRPDNVETVTGTFPEQNDGVTVLHLGTSLNRKPAHVVMIRAVVDNIVIRAAD